MHRANLASPAHAGAPRRRRSAGPRHTAALGLCALLAALAALGQAHAQSAPALQKLRSHHYDIHTNLTRDQVRGFAAHMDAIFEQYQRRFRGFRPRHSDRMPLVLLRSEDDYHRFMAAQGIDATNSGGMFFVTPRSQGLATWASATSRSRTLEVLQHEGFHQFAWNYLGPELPIWINEGLAQYFQDAVIIGQRMTIGLASADRVHRVREAAARGELIDFESLLSRTPEQWSRTLQTDPAEATLQYAQSWSIVYFLIHGDGGRYQNAFETYLKLVNAGRPSARAFADAFGVTSPDPIDQRWRAFAAAHEPDPVSAAASRLEFLGTGLGYLMRQGEPMPASFDALRHTLQTRRFIVTRQSHGVTTTMRAADDELFRYTRANGTEAAFELLEPARDDLPPRLVAPGLRPEPTLTWTRSDDGELIQQIEYR